MSATAGIDTPAALCRACVDLLDVTGCDAPCQGALALTAPVLAAT